MRGEALQRGAIVAKLREAEKLQGQGLTIPQACKRFGISDQKFYRWRIKYSALKEDEAQRLKAPQQENARFKKIVAEQALGHLAAEGLVAGKLVSPRAVATPSASGGAAAGVGASGLPGGGSASEPRRVATMATLAVRSGSDGFGRIRENPCKLAVSANRRDRARTLAH